MTVHDQYEYQGRNIWEGPSGVVMKTKNRYLASPHDGMHPIYTAPEFNPVAYDTFESAVVAIEYPYPGLDAEELEEP